MKLQQLRYLYEIARHDLNVSEAASALYTSQPGVSKQVALLEEELGVTIFTRKGKRLTGITEPGRHVLAIVGRILDETRNLKRVGEDYANESSGTLSVATTHTQARYLLPAVVKGFMERHPQVRLRLQEGNPIQVASWVADGTADLGIATEALAEHPRLIALPCYQWSHLVITPRNHPLLAHKDITLAMLAEWPLITYDPTFTGRTKIDRAFDRAGVAPNVVLTAIDSDVIKTYVALGLGIGIIAAMAFDSTRDTDIVALSANNLFETNTTRLAIRKGAWLRRYDFDFIELFAPHLTRRVIEATLRGDGEDPGL
ncbi:CysB family HTH-type transcriptional regulator [Sulfuricystis multivorans]|uniref:CysB family HTH-type transcriptional regulator n=1 Tax=Sulfuricystis multivorans TaxID=2211108 RepID=UPI000F822672|nr:CysB family HTH-type transcriptional regulator [Sulfuricystis multivorans]